MLKYFGLFTISLVLVLFSLSHSYSISDNDQVCCYYSSGIVSETLRLHCDGSGTVLGLSDSTTGNLSGISIPQMGGGYVDINCESLIVDNGINCDLGSGNLISDFFAVKLTNGSIYPKQRSCLTANSACGLTSPTCEWIESSSGNPIIVEEESGGGVIVEDFNETLVDDEDIGLVPFDPVDSVVCEGSDSFLFGALLSKDQCDLKDGSLGSGDCIYDPYRVGVLTQREGDSASSGNFESLKPDIMCISKSNRISDCEDINSVDVCNDYLSLNPKSGSLMDEYGCFWKEINDNKGKCVTQGLYYKDFDLYDLNDYTSINIEKSIKRKNFIQNPVFESTLSSDNWEYTGLNPVVIDNSYDNFFGYKYVNLNGNEISQLISGIPSSLNFEFLVFVDEENLNTLEFKIDGTAKNYGLQKDLFKFGNVSSNIKVLVYNYENTIATSTLEISLSGTDVDVLGVFMRLKGSDSSATYESVVTNVYPEELFIENSFDCSICSDKNNLGICSQSNLDSLGNCELISPTASSLYSLKEVFGTSYNNYKDDDDNYMNPYATQIGFENVFIEEDMVSCTYYQTQSQCENSLNKLNSELIDYHTTSSSTLCKWKDGTSHPGSGICYKDSNGDNLPDTINSGQLTQLVDYSDVINYYNNYRMTYDSAVDLNDYQLACDVLPPKLFVQGYKRSLDLSGNIVVEPVNHNSNDNGRLEFVYVRLEEYVSSNCDVYENYETKVWLNISYPDGSHSLILAKDLFLDYDTDVDHFEKVYSRAEFLGLIGDNESFFMGGSIDIFDRAGNKGVPMGFNARPFSQGPRFTLEFDPLSHVELFSSTVMTFETYDSFSSLSNDYCDIGIVDTTSSGVLIYNNESVLAEEIGFGISVGRIIQDYIDGLLSSPDELNVFITVTCKDIFDQVYSQSINLEYSTLDMLIIENFGSGAFNSDGVPYLNVVGGHIIDLNMSAKEGVVCNDLYLSSSPTVLIGTSSFVNTSSNPDYPLEFDETLGMLASISDEGVYELVIDCSYTTDSGTIDFNKTLDFIYDNSPVNMDGIKLVHRDSNLWSEISDDVFIYAVGGFSLGVTNMPQTSEFNSFVKGNVILSVDNYSEISSVSICGGISFTVDDSMEITEDVITLSALSTPCSVEYDDLKKAIKFISPIEVQDVAGNRNSDTIITYFEVNSPDINLTTLSGGIISEGVIYFNTDIPEFKIDLGLGIHRPFTCELILDIGVNTYRIYKNSTGSSLVFDIEEFTTEDLLSLPNIDFELTANCEDLVFSETDSITVFIEKDTQAPQIDSIDFINVGTNWAFPETGTDTLTISDVRIELIEQENYLSCKYYVSDVSPVQGLISNQNIHSKNQINTDNLFFSDSLILSRNSSSDSLLVLNTGEFDESSFKITVECRDAANNSASRVFSPYSLILFNYGDIDVSATSGLDNMLDLEIKSLINLSGSNILITNLLRDEVYFSGLLSGVDHKIEKFGTLFVLTINDIKTLSTVESHPAHPFMINFSFGTSLNLNDEFTILTDNISPQITYSVNTNDVDVIYGDILTGRIDVLDNPGHSLGLNKIKLDLYKGAVLVNSIEYNESLLRSEFRSFNMDNLTPDNYKLVMWAQDLRGNENQTEYFFETNDSFGITLLESSNTKLSDLMPFNWYTRSADPILKFSTARDVSSCELSPGSEAGYVGSTYSFSEISENNFELDLSTQSNFQIKSGKHKIMISCFREDLGVRAEVAVYLNYGNYVPDYTLDLDWSRTQIIDQGDSSKEILFAINQKAYFREVSCSAKLSGGGHSNQDIPLTSEYLTEVGKFSGKLNLTSGVYRLNVLCETPLGIKGVEKQYDFEIIQEDFNVELISMYLTTDSSANVDLSQNPLVIQDPKYSGGSQMYDVSFKTNYQTELVCEIETNKVGFLNYVKGFFVDDSQYIFPQEFGIYSATVEIDEDTTNMRISCLKGSEFSSDDFYFNFDFLDKNLYLVEVSGVSGEN